MLSNNLEIFKLSVNSKSLMKNLIKKFEFKNKTKIENKFYNINNPSVLSGNILPRKKCLNKDINELLFEELKWLNKIENILSLEWFLIKNKLIKIKKNIYFLNIQNKKLEKKYIKVKNKTELKLIYSQHDNNLLIKAEENKKIIMQKFCLCEKDIKNIFVNN